MGVNFKKHEKTRFICWKLYRTLIKETKILNKWSDIVCSWIRTVNIALKSLCNSYQSPSKIFAHLEKIILKIVQKGKGGIIAKTVLKKNKVRRISLPDFKIYYIEMETVWHWQRDDT